eukprot:TRINITY_DN16721_c0_g1_i9.p1 TRINITY_DN16721_c0_g1~~TRINITY_DN16721_c0_g1_i9.p1  ORF type:complete len:262 (+),score=47.31 TRINITY_DN16721_c0_g1_i9:169-954(+)
MVETSRKDRYGHDGCRERRRCYCAFPVVFVMLTTGSFCIERLAFFGGKVNPIDDNRVTANGASATSAAESIGTIGDSLKANQEVPSVFHSESSRRGALRRGFLVAGQFLMADAAVPAAFADWTVERPNGFKYERLEAGSEGTSPRDGPVKYAARAWIRFTGHVDGFDGDVFDSSLLRGSRKPAKRDYVEITAGYEPTLPTGMWEALKLMKVGEKGRFVVPPSLSYGEGAIEFEGDEDSKVKKVPAGTTLYYEVELVRIIRP